MFMINELSYVHLATTTSSVLYQLFSLLINGLFYGGIVVLIVYFLIYLPMRTKRAYRYFASQHGFTFFGMASRAAGYLGMLPGKSRMVVKGTEAHREVRLFQLLHIVRTGKSSKKYERTVLELSIKRSKAHVFINSRINDIEEQIDLDRSQRYKAEGDFGKYFDIFSGGNDHVSALALFAPDVMSLIMANYGFYDIEVVADRLYLYDYNFINNQHDLEDFYQRGLALAAEIDSNAPRKLALVGADGKPDPSGATALKRASISTFWSIVVVLIVCSSFFVPMLLERLSPQAATLTVFVPMVLMVLGLLFLYARASYRRRRYLKDRRSFATAHPVPKVVVTKPTSTTLP